MDIFACKSAEERQPFFQLAADKHALSEQIIEKDFWVCWTLKVLFSLPEINNHLIFKGGTSLSKVYKLIERFSEDIDISINKAFFGFINDKDPEKAQSNKKQKELLKCLSNECRIFVQNDFIQMLEGAFSKILGAPGNQWKIEIDQSDPDGQSLLFHYPALNLKNSKTYIRQVVKIEMGARGEHWPASNHHITPMLEEVLPNTINASSIPIVALDAERTFWEKATILHMFSHYPEDKLIPERQSRHFFDFYKMLHSEARQSSVNDLKLLARVVEHKSIYFKSAWANYKSARQGTLKIIPNERVLRAMELDYYKMSEMFYGTKISWDEIVRHLNEFEITFNH